MNSTKKGSQIQNFYRNKNIFVTGATGFMGRVLVEKILRSCEDVEKIYLLVREKKGKRIQERFDEIFNSIVFNKLKLANTDFLSKVVLVCGDCSKKQLGIDNETLAVLRSKVNIIFHTAAIINFEASLDQSVKSNVCATKEFLNLASTFEDLKAFVFVSTAYSNGFRVDVKEKVYRPPVGPDEIINLCQSTEKERLVKLTPSLIEGWPNTYTFSKCLAENIVQQYSQKFPIAIVRPSQVTSIAYEPLKGWIGNYYGPTGIISAAGVGLMRTFMLEKSYVIDMVPCDMAINLLITIPWSLNNQVTLEKSIQTAQENTSENMTPDYKNKKSFQVYNFVSGKSNPITYREFLQKSIKYLYEDPSEKCLWSLIFITTTSERFYMLLHIFLHLIPGFVIDSALRMAGKKPKMLNIYTKMKKLTLLLKSFTNSQWNFDDINVQTLWNNLSLEDKQLFNFDIKDLNWDEYVVTNARGIRLYVIRDQNENSQYAKKRYIMLRAANALLWTSLVILSIYSIQKLTRSHL